MSTVSLFDLTTELKQLQELKQELLANTTELERKRLTPQIIALSKQISSLTKTCLDYEIKSGIVMDRNEAGETIAACVGIIMDALNRIPLHDDLRKSFVNVSGVAQLEVIEGFIKNYPDRWQLVDEIAARIGALVESVKDAKPPGN